MAGTAAGIAKCNAKREANRIAREAQRKRAARIASGSLRVRPTVATVEPVADQPADGEVERVIPINGKALAVVTLDAASADAAAHLARIVQEGGVPHVVRFQAACKVLDLSLNRKQSGLTVPDDGSMAGILDRVATALALRRSAATATDASVIGAETVIPDDA